MGKSNCVKHFSLSNLWKKNLMKNEYKEIEVMKEKSVIPETVRTGTLLIVNREFNNELKSNFIKIEDGNLDEVKIVKDQDGNEKIMNKCDFKSLIKDWFILILKILPAIFVGTLLNLFYSITFGSIIFPNHEVLPKTYVQSGISMFLISAIISQIIYSIGLSDYKGGFCSLMGEVVPFLQVICQTIIDEVGVEHPTEIIATTMVAYSFSTIVIGILFYIMGKLKLGKIVSFYPRHIVLGCIGGIGIFLIQTGIQIITGYNFEFTVDYMKNIFTSPTLPIWLLSAAFAIILSYMRTKISNPLLTPVFVTVLPIVFYIVMFVGGLDMNILKEKGWFFKLNYEGEESSLFYPFWTYFNFKKVQWSVIPSTFSTISTMILFGILNASVNVSSLSVSLNVNIDINKELYIHGFTNLLSGLIGSLPNYLTYSHTLLFIRSGGGSNIASFLLAIVTSVIFIMKAGFIKYVPIIVVGVLVFNLGFDLVKTTLYDTIGILNFIEYTTVLTIIVVMNIWGFTQGIFIGIVLTLTIFVITTSRKNVIRNVYTGSELPSTVNRIESQKNFLNEVGAQIKILHLQGFIFFGSFHQINDYIKKLITENDTYSTKYIIFDFSLVHEIDYSASEAFKEIKTNLKNNAIYLILCNIKPSNIGPLNRVGLLSDADNVEGNNYFKYFNKYDSAIEWCENQLLETQYNPPKREYLLKIVEDNVSKIILNCYNYMSNVIKTSSMTMTNNSSNPSVNEKEYKSVNINDYDQPMKLFIQTFLNTNIEVNIEVFNKITKYFKSCEYNEKVVLWDKNKSVTENVIYIIESGEVLLYSEKESTNPIDKEILIGTFIPYSVTGDLEFFSRTLHHSKLVVQPNSKLWFIDYPNYDALCRENPDIALQLIHLFLHRSSEQLKNNINNEN